MKTAANVTDKQVDLVLIESDKLLVKLITDIVLKHKTVDSYLNPEDFIAKLNEYDKNVAICFNGKEVEDQITGLKLGRLLHERGFTNLFLFTGYERDFFDKNGGIPSYVTYIAKGDLNEFLIKFAY